jgi:ADP-L-glycero-D-manno-heptose 6-epimerase
LITGHQGFIGSNAYRYFQDQGHQVMGWEWCDQWPDVKGSDWVMHFGAVSSTVASDVDEVLTKNYDFTQWLLSQCLAHRVNLQYSSSAAVYGRTQHFQESGPADPQSPYAWSKYLTERYMQRRQSDIKGRGITVQGFRYFNVFGAGEDHKSQPSPWTLFRRQARSGVIKVFVHDPEPQRDLVPVERVIDIHERFIRIPESGVWNIGTGVTTTFKSVAQAVAAETGAVIQEIPLPESLAKQYQHYTCADLTKLNSTLAHYRV